MHAIVTAYEPPNAITDDETFGILHAFDPVTDKVLCRSDLPTYSLWDELLDKAAPAPVAAIRYGVWLDILWRPAATDRFCLTCRTRTAQPDQR
ncbi:hypothetical protein [Umezawaea sp. Da 62-37]|uniref:hypothetical protein n=1 Tax=Umezawaea sp. Da 62-37 TaxID=3075927 RepID=UPI0028F6EE53|nr:hypothetical protein [Umezawaea sp. Da 62-37]WNV83708.1 hypothetical protein RM788_36830 [Umezawaea sp. Da 62-37]